MSFFSRCGRRVVALTADGMVVAQRTGDRFLPGTFVKGRILVRVIPIFLALLVVFFRRCSATKIVNEVGRTARLGMNTQQEIAIGAQAYRQVLSESRTITSGEQYEMVKRCAQRLATLPAHEKRIERLEKELPKALEIYQAAGGR